MSRYESTALRFSFGLAAALAIGVLCGQHPALAANPKCPPVATGGEGATGDDWVDYGTVRNIKGRKNGANFLKATRAVVVEDTNPNHTLANSYAKTDGNAKVTHIHIKDDYGDTNFPSAAEGKSYWKDYFYAGWTITQTANATTAGNCVSVAYNGYNGSAVCTRWVDSDSAGHAFRDELQEIHKPTDDNTNAKVKAGDRAHHDSHVWIIVEICPTSDAATMIKWKNNFSPTFTWSHEDAHNDSIRGAPSPTNLFDKDYGIYRK